MTIRISRKYLALATVTLAGIAAAASYAAIPGGNGTISACLNGKGSLKVIDVEAGSSCPGSQKLLQWSQTGSGADAFVGRFGGDTGGAAAATGADCTLGEVLLTASIVKTAGGLPANGQLLPISQNQALFALLGTTYGGNGSSTFALPDLRAIAPNHMTYSICAYGVWPS
jgi:hypothetical protein